MVVFRGTEPLSLVDWSTDFMVGMEATAGLGRMHSYVPLCCCVAVCGCVTVLLCGRVWLRVCGCMPMCRSILMAFPWLWGFGVSVASSTRSASPSHNS